MTRTALLAVLALLCPVPGSAQKRAIMTEEIDRFQLFSNCDPLRLSVVFDGND